MKRIALSIALVAAVCSSAVAANRHFCRVADAGRSITYAPDYIWPSVETPSAADYLRANWLYNRVTKPAASNGYYVASTRYEARGEAVYAVYEYAPVPVVADRYSVPDLFFWLRKYDAEHTAAPKGQAVVNWLNAANLYTIAVTTRVVAADNELFAPTLEAIKEAVGFTDAEIAAALAYAKTDADPDAAN